MATDASKRPFVFISYAHVDTPFAAAFADRLRAAGVPHFRDVDAIQWGDDIPQLIHQALKKSTHIVVLISPGSAKSQWVAYEMGYARSSEVKIVPYLQHPSMELPGFISNRRCLKCLADEKRFISGLKRSLSARRSAATATSRTAPPPKLLRKLVDKIPRTRRDALEVLVSSRAVDDLIEALSRRPEVSQLAAEGLTRIGDPRALPYLVDGLGFSDPKKKVPIIPGVEDLFTKWGDTGLKALLEPIPDTFGTKEMSRWRDAVAKCLNNDNITMAIEFAKRNVRPRVETIGAAIQSGVRLTEGKLLPILSLIRDWDGLYDVLPHIRTGDLSQKRWIRTWVRKTVEELCLEPTPNRYLHHHYAMSWAAEMCGSRFLLRIAKGLTDREFADHINSEAKRSTVQ